MLRLFFILLFLPTTIFATKPCPPSPCLINGKFNINKCAILSKWVAVGEIKNIKHDKKGPPLNKDFAEFDFKINLLEKGKLDGVESLKFKIGWCRNMKSLPKKTAGKLFRFYGKSDSEFFHFHEFQM